MAISTMTLQDALDIVCSQGVPDPRRQASGYGDKLALDLGNQIMGDLITERFNWKWNRQVANPIYTNSFQQDYPQPAQPGGPIEWLEDCDICDINNSQVPKPLNWDGSVTCVKQLSRTSLARWRPKQICWMYNSDLSWGTWPGANTVLSPLLGNPTPKQNPVLNFIDAQGNYLIVTTFGTTGATQPSAPANSSEGVTVIDGSVTWTVVAGNSQGFRVDFLPSTGPVYQLTPSFQLAPPKFTKLGQLLSPIPDSFRRHFQRGLKALCLEASPDPKDHPREQDSYDKWIEALVLAMKQGDKEVNSYGLVPLTSPIESSWGQRGAYTADMPI